MWPKVPTTNHIVSKNYLAWLKATGKQTLHRAEYSKGLEVVSQELSRARISLKCVRSEHLGLVSQLFIAQDQRERKTNSLPEVQVLTNLRRFLSRPSLTLQMRTNAG